MTDRLTREKEKKSIAPQSQVIACNLRFVLARARARANERTGGPREDDDSRLRAQYSHRRDAPSVSASFVKLLFGAPPRRPKFATQILINGRRKEIRHAGGYNGVTFEGRDENIWRRNKTRTLLADIKNSSSVFFSSSISSPRWKSSSSSSGNIVYIVSKAIRFSRRAILGKRISGMLFAAP